MLLSSWQIGLCPHMVCRCRCDKWIIIHISNDNDEDNLFSVYVRNFTKIQYACTKKYISTFILLGI